MFKTEDFDSKDVGNQLYAACNALTLAGMTKDFKGNQVEALAVGIQAVAGAMEGVCAIIGQRKGIDRNSPIEDQRSTVNLVSSLVAALLVAKAVRVSFNEDQSVVDMEMNPIVYLAAIKAAETILGRNIDKELNPGLVGAARRWEKEHGTFGGWEEQTHAIQLGHTGPLH